MVSTISRVRQRLKKASFSFEEKTKLSGIADWIVDFYISDYECAVICCDNYDEFWKKLFLCQDIMRNSSVACCLVVGFEEITFDDMSVATKYDIPILTLRNLRLLGKVIRGEIGADEINFRAVSRRMRISHKIAESCRSKILDLLLNVPLTREDIIETLKKDFPIKTIDWCLSDLRGKGKIMVVAYLAGSKRAVYGVSIDQIHQAARRYALSKSWKKKLNVMKVVELLDSHPRGLTIKDLSYLSGLKSSQIVAVLRYLENNSKVERIIRDGNLYWCLI